VNSRQGSAIVQGWRAVSATGSEAACARRLLGHVTRGPSLADAYADMIHNRLPSVNVSRHAREQERQASGSEHAADEV
jgi:hypothetical protein